MRSISRDSFSTLLASIARNALSVVTSILLARCFGPSGKGLINGLETLRAGITALTTGIGTAITFLLTKERKSLGDLLYPLGLLWLALSVIVSAVVMVGALRGGSTDAVAVYAATVPAALILSWQSGLYLGLNRVKALNLQSLGLNVAFVLIVAVTGYALHDGPFAALVAWSAAVDIAALYMLLQVLPAAMRDGQRATRWQSARALFALGVRWGLYSVAGFLVYRVDSLMVAALLGTASFGIYSIAVSAGELLFMISRSVATASAYRIGSAAAAESAGVTATAVRVSTPAALAAAIVSYFAVGPLIDLLYGKAFEGAVTPIRILLPGIVAYASAGIFSQYFNLQMGRPIFMLLANLVLLVVQGGACLYLIPRFGLDGAAVASTVAYVAAAIASTWYFCAHTGVRVSRVWIASAEDVRQTWHTIWSLVGSR
jgi:O-antigen/teichoic acid export membrane protein